jgi:hypothetical protein
LHRSDVVEPPPERLAEAQKYFYGTTPDCPERLKISAPFIRFAWYARATGGESLENWEAGILQSISHAAWTACYSNGKTLEYRLNTELGLVRDGRPEEYPFYSAARRLPAGRPNSREIDVDHPGVTFVTEHSGELFDHDDVANGDPALLISTQGNVRLVSFLAVRNKQNGAIVTLGEIEWALRWDGRYDFGKKLWTPSDPEAVTAITREDPVRARIFADAASDGCELPFSLRHEIANLNHQIRTAQGWVLCKEGVPKRADSPKL